MKNIPVIDTHAHFSLPRPQEESQKGQQLIDEIDALRRMVGVPQRVKDTDLKVDALLADMEKNGIEMAWLHQLSFKHILGYEVLSNNEIAAALRAYPGKFKGFAGVDPYAGPAAIYEIKRCIRELGFSGVKFNPNDYTGYWLNDKDLMYPLLETCCLLKVPVSIHTGITPGRMFRMKHNDPLLVDDLAVDFPGLTIIIEHMGYPWTTIAYDIVRRHPNLYLTITAVANILIHKSSRAFMMEFLKMLNIIGSQRILWGSDWTATPNTAEVLQFLRKFNVPFPLRLAGMGTFTEAQRRHILYENAHDIIN
ncbi:MAG: amidohydrolase family protein [Acidobacteria bacterium]|jgi:hypothetical protein|nr:amidohydrolase family protein [Acidobacteriota bacterium]